MCYIWKCRDEEVDGMGVSWLLSDGIGLFS